MKTIIRIEYIPDGIGIFTTFLSNASIKRSIRPLDDFCVTAFVRHLNFNCPLQDRLDIRKYGKEWFCAYKSIEQLQKWITPEELKLIISEGYTILMLDVYEYQEGRDQIIYTKESITSYKDITSLFE